LSLQYCRSEATADFQGFVAQASACGFWSLQGLTPTG
jgi:hypothetical protein